jgi:hypothetical protein
MEFESAPESDCAPFSSTRRKFPLAVANSSLEKASWMNDSRKPAQSSRHSGGQGKRSSVSGRSKAEIHVGLLETLLAAAGSEVELVTEFLLASLHGDRPGMVKLAKAITGHCGVFQGTAAAVAAERHAPQRDEQAAGCVQCSSEQKKEWPNCACRECTKQLRRQSCQLRELRAASNQPTKTSNNRTPVAYHLMKPRFPLGRTVATSGAIALNIDLTRYLLRHHCGDWATSVTRTSGPTRWPCSGGERILSCYQLPEGQKIYILTEWDRSSTCVMLSEEY